MPQKYAAKVDINNDQIDEYLVQLEYSSGAGRGCGYYHLGILNETRDKLSDSFPSPTLGGGNCNGGHTKAFEFRGKYYYESKYPDGRPDDNHEVYLIAGNSAKLVCDMDQKQMVDALDMLNQGSSH